MELEIENPNRQQKQCVNQDEKGGEPVSGLELEITDADNTFELSLEDSTLKSNSTAPGDKRIINLENIPIKEKVAQFKPEPPCQIKQANEKNLFGENNDNNRTEINLDNHKKYNSTNRKLQNEPIFFLRSKIFNLIYSLMVALSIFFIAFLLIQVYSKSDSHKNLQNKVQNVPRKVEKLIEKEPVLKSESQKVTTKQSRSKSEVIYSWTNEKGQKMYSNVGFPQDGKYTDPKIEWQ